MQRDVLPSVLAHRAGEEPAREFLRTTEGVSYTYAQVHEQCLIWADAYERAGITPGQTVATMLPTVPEAVFAWLGLAWLRAVEVPVNTSYRGGMLDYVLRDAGVTVIVIAEEFLDRLLEIWPESLRLVVVVGAAAELPPMCVRAEDFVAAAEPSPRPEPRISDLAAVIYTSGTTGRSKGVMVSWRHLNRLSTGLAPEGGLDDRDVFYLPLPMFHGSGKGSVFLMALVGGVVVLRARFRTPAFWPDVRRHGCTTTMLLGAMAQFVFAEPARTDDADSPLRNVLMVPVIPDVAAFRERFGVRVHTWYGITEAGCPIATDDWRLEPAGSCGRARPGYVAAVLDDEDRPVPAGTVGELAIRADGPWMLMAGYWGNPTAALAVWRNLWLHTGDAAYLDEAGNVFFVDRQKDAMRRRGENISSVEVELETNTHPAVLESAAYAVPSQWGEDDVMIAVTCREGRTVRADELFEYLAGRLPHFMVPRYIEIMTDLPRTPTQKVQKNVLRERGATKKTWDREAAGAVVGRERITLPRASGGV